MQMRKKSETELEIARSAIKASLAQLERATNVREAHSSSVSEYLKKLANGKDTIIVFDNDITEPET
jgi:S-adenosylmethionine synthetase